MEAANKIAIITDTCCDLPQEYLKEYPIFCVPLVVTSGTESYRDNIDITVETIYARQKNEEFQTSLPARRILRMCTARSPARLHPCDRADDRRVPFQRQTI